MSQPLGKKFYILCNSQNHGFICCINGDTEPWVTEHHAQVASGGIRIQIHSCLVLKCTFWGSSGDPLRNELTSLMDRNASS